MSNTLSSARMRWGGHYLHRIVILTRECLVCAPNQMSVCLNAICSPDQRVSVGLNAAPGRRVLLIVITYLLLFVRRDRCIV